MSTRLVGAMVMTHGTTTGSCCREARADPRRDRADLQEGRREGARHRGRALDREGSAHGRAERQVDDREGIKPGAKYYEWERKGVPVRIELGPRDLEQSTVMIKRRISGQTAEGKAIKETMPMKDLGVSIGRVLDEFQSFLFTRAQKLRDDNTVSIDTWSTSKPCSPTTARSSCGALGRNDRDGAFDQRNRRRPRSAASRRGAGPGTRGGKCVKSGSRASSACCFAKNY